MNVEQNRNYGLDAFRCVAAFLVVLVHCVKTTVCPEGSWGDAVTWYMWLLSLCCVNCFGLMTGYLGGSRHNRLRSFISLYLQVAFYIFIVFILQRMFLPQHRMRITELFPIVGGTYWYFTAYTVIAVMFPLLQKGIDSMSKSEFRTVTGCFICIYLVDSMDPAGPLRWLGSSYGFTPIWLLALYLAGAYLRKYPEDFKFFSSKKAWCAALLLPLIGTLLHLAYYSWGWDEILRKSGVKIFMNVALYDAYRGEHCYMFYTHPLIFFESFMLLVACSKMQLAIVGRFLAVLSPYAFGVYLAHCNLPFTELCREPVINWIIKTFDWRLFPLLLLLFVLVIVIGTGFADFLRNRLFAVVGITELIRKKTSGK